MTHTHHHHNPQKFKNKVGCIGLIILIIAIIGLLLAEGHFLDWLKNLHQ